MSGPFHNHNAGAGKPIRKRLIQLRLVMIQKDLNAPAILLYDDEKKQNYLYRVPKYRSRPHPFLGISY